MLEQGRRWRVVGFGESLRRRVNGLRLSLLWLWLLPLAQVEAQDTFSLIIVDAATGLLVSAGGSCIDGDALPGGAAAIATVLPGVGVLHTQSYYVSANQLLGTRLLQLRLSAKQLVDSLVAADASLTPAYRQYACITLAQNHTVDVAAHTGSQCAPWAGERTGADYVLAGNILLDSTVLLRMEAALLHERAAGGDVVAQARAALVAATFAGADRRCLSEGLSCRSAFLRAARLDDVAGKLLFDVVIAYPQDSHDPLKTLVAALDQARQQGMDSSGTAESSE